jgi:hypothetical protein
MNGGSLLFDAEDILKIAQIKSIIANGLDESFIKLRVDLVFIDYDRPYFYHNGDILFLDKLKPYKSEMIKDIYEELMARTHDPDRPQAIDWCFDNATRKSIIEKFNNEAAENANASTVSEDSGTGSLDQ